MGYGVAARGAAMEMMRTMGNSGSAILSKIDESIGKSPISRVTSLPMLIWGVAVLLRFADILIGLIKHKQSLIHHKQKQIKEIQTKIQEALCTQLENQQHWPHTRNNMHLAISDLSQKISNIINNTLMTIEKRHLKDMQLDQKGKFDHCLFSAISVTINNKLKQIEENQNKKLEASTTQMQAAFLNWQLLLSYSVYIRRKNNKLTTIEEKREEALLTHLKKPPEPDFFTNTCNIIKTKSEILSDTRHTMKQIEEQHTPHIIDDTFIGVANPDMYTAILDTINHTLQKIEVKLNKMQDTHVQEASRTKQLLCQILSITN